MRTRPIFATWAVDVAVDYMDDVVTRDQVIDAMGIAGLQVGLGDFRPRYGRFETEVK
jgi:hypothetical protein